MEYKEDKFLKGKAYLRLLEENKFITVVEGISEVLETDIPIKIEDFEEYLNTKDVIKHYRLRENPIGDDLFDYIEEYIPDPIPIEQGDDEFKLEVDYRLSKLELGV